jgi:hypothetical protein
MTRRRMRTGLAAFVFVLVPVSISVPCLADGPGVRECLSSSESSLTLRNGHKLRGARAQLLVCSSPSCPADIRAECTRRIDVVNAALPTLVFTAKGGAGQELSAVTVTMDGERVADHLDGTALSLDPGSHELTFEAKGQPPLTKTLVLHEGEKNRRETILIGAPAAPSSPSPVVATSDSGHGRRVLGVVAGATGLAGVVLGGVFGGLTFSSWGEASDSCPKYVHCSAQAISEGNNASTYATVSTIGFIAGGVLLAGGLTLYFTAPKDQAAGVGVELAPRGAAVVGRF